MRNLFSFTTLCLIVVCQTAQLRSNDESGNLDKILTKVEEYIEDLKGSHNEDNQFDHDAATAEADCLRYFKVNAQTGNKYGASQNPYYGTNPRLMIELKSTNTKYSVELPDKKNQGVAVEYELSVNGFTPNLPSCITINDIFRVYLNAPSGGTDGWYVTSITTSTAKSDNVFSLLTSDPELNKWIDYNEEYKYSYNAKLVPLTLVINTGRCITKFKIEAMTGDKYGASFNSKYMHWKTHHIELMLKDNQQLTGNLQSPANRNQPYTMEIDFGSGFSTGGQCLDRSDIQLVTLTAGGGDGWYIESIFTYIKIGDDPYHILTSDPVFNKWLDSNEPDLYPYDATKQILNLEEVDRPQCGYGKKTCECKSDANVCIFGLEIDEIRTFSSYRKFSVDEANGMYVRGTQGVIYYIDEATGEETYHPFYKKRQCGKQRNDNCTQPQFVDGKTYRMAIAVNGQIPGPTIVVHDQQIVVIVVHNNLSTEGISIHWHGMHQIGTPWMDGVGQVTQCQIGPSSVYTYVYRASPSGTFWYHSHSGAQRTDGFFGGMIVREKPDKLSEIKLKLSTEYSVDDFEDLPGDHTLSLLDWQHEASLDLFSQLNAGLGFYPTVEIGEVPGKEDERYDSTRSIERAEVGPVPYFSGLINGKGRHNNVPYAKTRLSVFTVEENKHYRFRLIGAQGLYAYKFSIDGHKLTVVGTDGYWIQPQKNVDFIIIHTGERYDFILKADAAFKNYWIRAETLEINQNGDGPPYESLGHVAEAILQYRRQGQDAPDIPSTQYDSIKSNSPAPNCSGTSKCKAINCPFQKFQENYHIECVNVHELHLLEPTPSDQLPQAYPSAGCPNCLHFINFNFEGDSETSSVNGRNFILPPAPPQTQHEEFKNQSTICSLTADCNPSTLDCLCTHVIDIPYKKTVQFVLSAIGAYDNAHPIHLHGHTFHVVKVGYPEYDDNTGFILKNGNVSVHNTDIHCGDSCEGKGPECNSLRCTKPSWSGGNSPSLSIDTHTIRKDTVMLPAGGYAVINFISDNPGHWFLHCHIEVHQLEGMAMIVNEAFDQQQLTLQPPSTLNKCGDFTMSMEEYKKYSKLQESIAGQGSPPNHFG